MIVAGGSAMGEGRWAMGDGKWEMGNGKWAMVVTKTSQHEHVPCPMSNYNPLQIFCHHLAGTGSAAPFPVPIVLRISAMSHPVSDAKA